MKIPDKICKIMLLALAVGMLTSCGISSTDKNLVTSALLSDSEDEASSASGSEKGTSSLSNTGSGNSEIAIVNGSEQYDITPLSRESTEDYTLSRCCNDANVYPETVAVLSESSLYYVSAEGDNHVTLKNQEDRLNSICVIYYMWTADVTEERLYTEMSKDYIKQSVGSSVYTDYNLSEKKTVQLGSTEVSYFEGNYYATGEESSYNLSARFVGIWWQTGDVTLSCLYENTATLKDEETIEWPEVSDDFLRYILGAFQNSEFYGLTYGTSD